MDVYRNESTFIKNLHKRNRIARVQWAYHKLDTDCVKHVEMKDIHKLCVKDVLAGVKLGRIVGVLLDLGGGVDWNCKELLLVAAKKVELEREDVLCNIVGVSRRCREMIELMNISSLMLD